MLVTGDAARRGELLHGDFRRASTHRDSPPGGDHVHEIVARAREGDRAALGELYTRYAPSVFAHVSNLLRDAHEAEDVTQQVFLKLISVLGRYERREVPFSAWILRVAHNAAIDNLRRRRAIPTDGLLADQEISHARDSRKVRYLRDGLASLPLDQRRVLLMRHLIGMSPAEIAERMGKTESSIHGLHHRGRGALRETLSGMQEGPSTRRALEASA
jgi:RNA polymerase sigma-70 factor (ECF subfamily)